LTFDIAPTSNDELPDEELVSRALTGKRDAFTTLVRRHERRLFRFLARNTASDADVEDAMQQALLKAYVHLAKYNPRWRFTTWLFTIALRELRSAARRHPRMSPLHPTLDPAAPREQTFIDRDPGDLWLAARRLLTAPQYTALWLRYGEDLAVRDVARAMSRPRVWVSVTLHRACATLRQAVPDPQTADRPDDRHPAPSTGGLA
jgi:RNA polymerase sigma-70 factor (ECF subfamily)